MRDEPIDVLTYLDEAIKLAEEETDPSARMVVIFPLTARRIHDELAALRAPVESEEVRKVVAWLRNGAPYPGENRAADLIEHLALKLHECERGAVRYLWLRQESNREWLFHAYKHGNAEWLDAAIDATMSADQRGSK